MKFSACAAGGCGRWRKKGWCVAWPAGLIALSTLLAGCQNAPFHITLLQGTYHPNNIYVNPSGLSPNLRRVAVLPIAAETDGENLPEGCAALTPVLWDQLIKAKKFEVVMVNPACLRSGTGQPAWTGGEDLPADIMRVLRQEYGCDGVLFAELTAYRAYPPLAVGWRLKLVDAHTGRIIWAADEMFDAARPAVYHGVQRFTDPGLTQSLFCDDNWWAADSPTQLGRFAAARLLKSLPNR